MKTMGTANDRRSKFGLLWQFQAPKTSGGRAPLELKNPLARFHK